MSDWEDYAEEIEEDPVEADCPYGFEFCEDPQTRDLDLCTTDCSLYMKSVEEEQKETTKEPVVSKCPFCPKVYSSEQSLSGHKNANHWKRMRETTKP